MINNFLTQELKHSDEKKLKSWISTLVKTLKSYDLLRERIETQGGAIALLDDMSDILRKPLGRNCQPGSEASLTTPDALRHELNFSSAGTIALKMVVSASGMPSYYLARTDTDYWHLTQIVVEDVYRSYDFPLPDARIVSISKAGRQVSLVRMAFLREKFAKVHGYNTAHDRTLIDQQLCHIGANVLRYAWHSEQEIAICASTMCGLPDFQSALELIYLIMGVDACLLRGSLSPAMMGFFENVYPSPFVHALLSTIASWNGAKLDSLKSVAQQGYDELNTSFSDFLACEVTRLQGHQDVPIQKLLLANLRRLNRIKSELVTNRDFCEARITFEKRAREIALTILR